MSAETDALPVAPASGIGPAALALPPTHSVDLTPLVIALIDEAPVH